MSTGWKQLSLNCSIEAVDQFIAAAQARGAQAITQQNGGDESYYDLAAPGEPKWQKQKVTALFADQQLNDEVLVSLRVEMSVDTPFEIESLSDQDWETAWQDQYVALAIDEKLWVCPSWIKHQAQADEVVVKIDPGLAFGTGTHETTQLCMRALKQVGCQDKTVLDYGCGSGILAITALKLGAKQAVGVDIDPKAEAATAQNALINGVSDQLSICSQQDIAAEGFAAEGLATEGFDIVVANILAGALVELQANIENALNQQGRLILSGILAHQAKVVEQAYGKHFAFTVLEKNEWVTLIGERK